MKYLLFVAPESLICDLDTLETIFVQNNITYATPNGYYWELDVPQDFPSPSFDSVEEQLSFLIAEYTTLDSVYKFIAAEDFISTLEYAFYEAYKTPLS